MLGDRKVFIAEIGVEYSHNNIGGSLFISGTPLASVVVVAKSYDDAEKKIEVYLETIPVDENQSIVGVDGSLKNLEKDKIKLLGLRISDTKIIW